MVKERKKLPGKNERLERKSKELAKSSGRVNLKVKVKKSASPDLSIQLRHENAQKQYLAEKGSAKQVVKGKKRKISRLAIGKKKEEIIKKKKKNLFRQMEKNEIKTEVKKKNLTDTGQGKALYEKVERDKRFMMWAGVTFFMILIAFFWLYNTKQAFERSSREENNNFTLTDWQKLTDEVSEKMSQMKQDWENIESFNEASTSSPAGLPASESVEREQPLFTTSTELKITQEELDKLKERLGELEQKLEGE